MQISTGDVDSFSQKIYPRQMASGDDWVTLWPEKYATSSEAITFEGWK